MNLKVAFTLTSHTLQNNKAHTSLTVLGVAIGVGSVVAIVALGSGAQRQIEDQIQNVGTNIVVVVAGNLTTGGVRQGQGVAGTLTPDDANAIRESVPTVESLTSIASTRAQIVWGNQNWSTTVQGTDVDWPKMRSWPLASGRFFTSEDVERAAKVATLGIVVRDQLFGPQSNAIGQAIRVNQQVFMVVGVMTAKGSGMGRDQDDAVFVPYTTVQKKLRGITSIDAIMLSADSPDDTASTADAVAAVLRARHKIPPDGPDDFMVRTIDDMAAMLEQTTATMTLFLVSVAAVSLLVGGIGVMNIMLVSVTERTQEIGLRMAVGARPRDVLGQFLLEALMLTAAGGVLGVLMGAGAARAATIWAGWPTSLSAASIALGLGVAVATGVCFGLYPANKAASLDPIVAMQYE